MPIQNNSNYLTFSNAFLKQTSVKNTDEVTNKIILETEEGIAIRELDNQLNILNKELNNESYDKAELLLYFNELNNISMIIEKYRKINNINMQSLKKQIDKIEKSTRYLQKIIQYTLFPDSGKMNNKSEKEISTKSIFSGKENPPYVRKLINNKSNTMVKSRSVITKNKQKKMITYLKKLHQINSKT